MGVARRHPGWAVVPAPLNFERTRRRRNVDHVVVDCEAERAIGVQVRNKVTERDIEEADTDRVVFIDGMVDFNNVRAMRTKSKSSNVEVVPWPGIIGAKMVNTMKPRAYNLAVTPLYRRLSREMVGDIKVDYTGMVDKIEERIMDKL